MVQIDDSVDQPRRKRRFLDRSLAGALLVSIGVDEHAIDGLGLHRLQRIGDDPGQAFSLQFGSSIPGQLVGGFEGEPNPSARMWNLGQSGEEIWNGCELDRRRFRGSADLPRTSLFSDRAIVGNRRGHDQDVMPRPFPLQC